MQRIDTRQSKGAGIGSGGVIEMGNRRTKPFAAGSEHFYTKRIEGPLPENLKTALQSVQKAKECKHKVPVVEVEENGRYYLLIPRQRLHAIAVRYTPTLEEVLLSLTDRRRI